VDNVVELPGCPQGTVAAASLLMEKKPNEVIFTTTDEDCIKTLRVMLPLIDYRIKGVETKEGKYYIKVARE